MDKLEYIPGDLVIKVLKEKIGTLGKKKVELKEE